MIDNKFIITFTNGLYTTDADSAPRYDEFRDMFSSGQLLSKQWAVSELSKIIKIQPRSMIITGSWFGTLGLLMKYQFPTCRIVLLDIDPRCEKYITNIVYNYPDIVPITGDMYDYKYVEEIVVNTSCEHIPDVRKWLNLLPPRTTVVLQSNNFFAGHDHVNCVNSVSEFMKQTNLSDYQFSGEFKTPMYTRYMLIGLT